MLTLRSLLFALAVALLAVPGWASVSAAGTLTARQVVLRPKDVPGHPEIRSQTHSISGIAGCPDAYQSVFGSGLTLGAGYAMTSVVFRCHSASDATQAFADDAAFQHSYFNRAAWHYRSLPHFTFRDTHIAWLNEGWAGHGLYTLSLLSVRDLYVVMLQVSYQGITRAGAGNITKRLASTMSRRIAAAEG